MRKLLLLLFVTSLFSVNAQYADGNPFLKKMGGNGKNFFVQHEEKIDFSKSFTIQYSVNQRDPLYFGTQNALKKINKFLEGKSEVMDFVKQDGEWVYVSDYLIYIENTGFKIVKGNKDVLKVFIKSFNKSVKKRMKDWSRINACIDYILNNSSKKIIEVW